MRPAVSFSCLAALACASSHSQTARPTSETVRVVSETGINIRMAGGSTAATNTVAFAPDQVFGVLAAVYDSLGIPIGTVDSKTRLIGNTGFKAHQKLGKTSLGKLIDCGKTQGFPSADSYDISMQVSTQVTPTDQGSTIATLLEASGRPMAFGGEYVRCSSLGVLEAAIVAGVRDRLKS